MAEINPIQALSDQIEALISENEQMRESLGDAMLSLRLEDRGWLNLGQTLQGEGEGLSLDELKELSESIRPHLAVTGLIRRGASLHTSYCWARGINIDGTQDSSGRGAKSAMRRFFTNQVNQDSIFSDAAHGVLARARYADGMVFALCDLSKREVRLIPLREITGIKVNPDFPSEIWAYQRTWNPDPSGNAQPRVRWIYTSRYQGPKQASYTANGRRVDVLPNAIIVDLKANAQVGWVLGVPDAAPALPHYNSYVRFLGAGEAITDSRAKLLMRVTSKTKDGAKAAAAKIAGMTGYANAVSMTDGSDVSMIQGSEKGYDFRTGDTLAAMMALSLDVPLAELLSSAQVGGNYASSASLTPATINAMQLKQSEWAAWYGEIFRVFGLGDPEISFDPIEEPDFYRQAQGLTLLSTTLTDSEYRGAALDLLNIAGDPNETPTMLAARSEPQQTAAQQASPDQGRGNGTGGADSGQRNDLRSDVLSNALAAVQLDEMRSLVERFEAAVSQSKV